MGTQDSLLTLCFILVCSSLITVDAHNVDGTEIGDRLEQNKDRVRRLPGLDKQPKFKQYSGYLQGSFTRQLHYWFVESQSDPEKDPLLLWLNGGPGCSSLGGFLTELGPFLLDDDGETLHTNHYSWNKAANVLFLESPAGVGFSYAENDDLTASDDTTALENYNALVDFLKRFPEYRDNDLYMTGESYAGVYIPTLMLLLNNDPSINLKGAAIGNAYFNVDILQNTMFFFMYYHGIIGTKVWNDLTSSCCDVTGTNCSFVPPQSDRCQQLVAEMLVSNALMTTLNPYNINSDCESSDPPGLAYQRKRIKVAMDLVFAQMSGLFHDEQAVKLIKDAQMSLASSPPCNDDGPMGKYLNKPRVRTALNVPSFVQQWTQCSDTVSSGGPGVYTQTYTDMRPQLKQLLETNKYRFLVYNGDLDMVCDFIGDRNIIEDLGRKEVEPYKPWHFTDEGGYNQIGGFVRQYENITFMTVKGAGHMVPTDQPLGSLTMLQKFLHGEKF